MNPMTADRSLVNAAGQNPAQPAFGSTLARITSPAIGPLLAAALDEVDVGLALVDSDGRVLHLNHRAQQCLAEGVALGLRDGRVTAPQGDDAEIGRAHV